jgi:hypothetical protein
MSSGNSVRSQAKSRRRVPAKAPLRSCSKVCMVKGLRFRGA